LQNNLQVNVFNIIDEEPATSLSYKDSFRGFGLLQFQPRNNRTGNRTSEKTSTIKILEYLQRRDIGINETMTPTPVLKPNQNGSREDGSGNEISVIFVGILVFVGSVMVFIFAVNYCYLNRNESETAGNIQIQKFKVRIYSQ